MRRYVYDVAPCRDGWTLKVGRNLICVFGLKREAVSHGRERARAVLRKGGLAQMKVRGRNGRIQFEATYGQDPRRYKS